LYSQEYMLTWDSTTGGIQIQDQYIGIKSKSSKNMSGFIMLF
jgi:hypothetical protein